MRIFTLSAAFIAICTLSACSGTRSTSVAELTKNDKYMSCTDLELEITEATFLRDKAERNRSLSFRNIIMPLSYPSTYLSASDAVSSASNRIDYLSRLYAVKGCDAQQQQYAAAEAGYGGYAPQGQAAPTAYERPAYGH